MRKSSVPDSPESMQIAENRYGARAFFTWKGYASRNCETELAPGRIGFGRTATVAVLV